MRKPEINIWADRNGNHIALNGKEMNCVTSYCVKTGDNIPRRTSEVTITFDAIVNDTTGSNNQTTE